MAKKDGKKQQLVCDATSIVKNFGYSTCDDVVLAWDCFCLGSAQEMDFVELLMDKIRYMEPAGLFVPNILQ